MKITLDIPDAIYTKYQSIHQTRSEDEIRTLLKARVTKWIDKLVLADPTERSLLITADDRRDLESCFQTTIEDAKDLTRKTRNLASIQIGSIQFPLTSGDIMRLREQASFHGWDPQQFVDNTCREICDYFMNRF